MSVQNKSNNAAPGTNSRGLPPVYPEATLCSIQENPLFQNACKAAEIPVTRRQASKWKNKQGSAYAALQVYGAQGIAEIAAENAAAEDAE